MGGKVEEDFKKGPTYTGVWGGVVWREKISLVGLRPRWTTRREVRWQKGGGGGKKKGKKIECCKLPISGRKTMQWGLNQRGRKGKEGVWKICQTDKGTTTVQKEGREKTGKQS